MKGERISDKITRPLRELVEKFPPSSTPNGSDALDKLGLRPGIVGILPLYEGCPKLLGTAITMRVTAAGPSRPSAHMGWTPLCPRRQAMSSSSITPGAWMEIAGKILTYASIQRGIHGVAIDGASRDVDVRKMLKFPVYARGRVPLTARGRTRQDTSHCLIRFAGVQVRPGDIIQGDDNGVAIIPQEQVEEILAATGENFQRALAIVEELKRGTPLDEVDKKGGCDQMMNG